jgi:hypothetical protein
MKSIETAKTEGFYCAGSFSDGALLAFNFKYSDLAQRKP